MDFDLDILIWLLIPLFGLLGRKKKKKKPQAAKPTLPKQETILVEQPVSSAPSSDPFEEALRQIKEALGEKQKPPVVEERPVLKPKPEHVPVQARMPEEMALESEFHEHSFPQETVRPLPVTTLEESFEFTPTLFGDESASQENVLKEDSGTSPAFEEPVLIAEEKPDRWGPSKRPVTELPRTEDLQRAFVWREVLGPPKSQMRRS